MKQQDVVKVVVALAAGGAIAYWLTRPRAQLAPPAPAPSLPPEPMPAPAPARPQPPPPKTPLQGASTSTVLGTRYALVATASHRAVSDVGMADLSNAVISAVHRTYLNVNGAPAGRWTSSPSVVQDDSVWSATTTVSVIFEVTMPGDSAVLARTIAQRLGTQLAAIGHVGTGFAAPSITWSSVTVQPLPSYMS